MRTCDSRLPTAQQRIATTIRPDGNPIGYQRWSNLLFAHWRIPVAAVRDLIPKRLCIDTFDGDAWVGLVPFYMSNVRPAGLPAVPWISNFCETNLRTYVHLDGKPGVWFFSLDASRVIPVLIARRKWHLNYHWASMQLNREPNRVQYASRRFNKESSGDSNISAHIGDVLTDDEHQASVDSLEYFLAERYLLYCQQRDGQLRCGQVHHSPYPLRAASADVCEETLNRAAGIEIDRAPDHVLFSEGVQVEIFPLRKI